MRFRTIFAGSALCLIWLAVPVSSQTSQISKTWELGHRSVADQLDPFVQHVEHKYQRFDFQELSYVQQTEDRIAAAAGVRPYQVRITGGSEWYGFLLPQRVLYISLGLLERISSEAELAGLLAHELGHEPKSTTEHFPPCVFAAPDLPGRRSLPGLER